MCFKDTSSNLKEKVEKKKLMLYKAQEVAVQSVVKTSVFEFLMSTVERNITARGEERRKCSGNKGLKRITKKEKSAKETKRGSSALLSLGEADRS